MSVTVLLSCMHQKDASIIERTNIQTDVLIINQCDVNKIEEFSFLNKTGQECKAKIVFTTERGISRSRNMALLNSWGDYCIFADDDERLMDGYADTIVSAFSRNPKADIIAFNYVSENTRLRNCKTKTIHYERRASRNHYFSSVALTFLLHRIKEKELFFDVRLGAGSGIISSGEESAWQSLAHKKGLIIYQSPDYISSVAQSTSTWFRGYGKEYFYDLGANLTARYGIIKYVYQFYYLYRFYGETTLSIWQQLFYINAGMNGFKRGLGFEDYFKVKR